jgi:hypothetical protein
MRPDSIEGYYAPYFKPNAAAISLLVSHHVTIQGNDISNTFRGIGADGCFDLLIKNNTIHHVSEDGISALGKGIVIEDNHIYDHRHDTTTTDIYGVISGDFTVGEVVTLDGTDAKGIVYKRSSVLSVYPTSQNTFYDYCANGCGRDVIGQNGRVTDITRSDPPHTDGFQMHGNASNVIIRGNTIDRRRVDGIGSGDGQGFKFWVNVTNVTFENNIVDAYNVIIEGIDDAYFYNNTFYTEPKGLKLTCRNHNTTINDMDNNLIASLNYIDTDGIEGNYVRVINHEKNIFKLDPDGLGADYIFTRDGTELVIPDFDDLFVNSVGGDFTPKQDSIICDGTHPGTLPGIAWAGALPCEGHGIPQCTVASDCPPRECNTVVCTASQCVYTPVADGISCDDGTYCNGVDTCQSGSCVSSGNPCPADGYSCTTETCTESTQSCTTSQDDAACDDTNPCTDDSCTGSGGDPGTGCTHSSNTASCDDGITCTTGDACGGGACQPGTPDNSVCRDAICTDSVCHVATGCEYLPAGCDVGNVPTGYISWWRFDGDASDSGPGGNDGTFVGDAAITTDPERGQVLALDGEGDHVDITNDDIRIATKTVSFWYKRNSFTSVSSMTILGTDGSFSNNYKMSFRDDGRLYVRWMNSTDSSKTYQAVGFNPAEAVWVQGAVVWDVSGNAVNVSVYKDGSFFGSYLSNEGYSTNYAVSFWIGDEGNNVPFNGTIDEVMVYGRALSAAEIVQIYDAQK